LRANLVTVVLTREGIVGESSFQPNGGRPIPKHATAVPQ
jgi:hypothetical protein